MITEGEIANFLFVEAKQFGIDEVYQWGNIPEGEVKKERITIQVKPLRNGERWCSCFAEINICVPFIDQHSHANLIRLGEVEHLCHSLLKKRVAQINGQWVRYDIDTLNRLKDDTLRCYYINAHLRFEVMNINY